MRSRAHFRSHPLHPMLIVFPAAFLTAVIACDLIGFALRDGAGWFRAAAYLTWAGVISGLIAAVPGLIDYLYAVPPKSSAKRTATYHMLLNVSALTLFVLSWFLRTESLAPTTLSLLCELGGTALLGGGGWLGGTLVYRNQIGVDHRYAHAGRWNEEYVSGPHADWVTVASIRELQVNQMKLVHLAGRRVVLARTSEGYRAFDDHCTHRGGSLADGVLSCGVVQCPWHGSQFDVESGEVTAGPAAEPIETLEVRISGDAVQLRLQRALSLASPHHDQPELHPTH